MRLFLSGFMASGKTTVGRELARQLNLPFVDLDETIECRQSSTIERIFALSGEEAFRDLESRELARVVELDAVVVALGGGTLERDENRRLVGLSGTLVWLDTPRSTILSRLSGGEPTRPLYLDRDRAMRLLDERLATYQKCDLRVCPRASETAAEIAAAIAIRLAE